MRIYVIGDVHGQLDMLRAAHERIEADRTARRDRMAPVLHLGDYVDRGPDSRGVIDFLIDGKLRGKRWIFLRGNHDRIFQGFLADHDYRDPVLRADLSWVSPNMGGSQTLASYGVHVRRIGSIRPAWDAAQHSVPPSHVEFLRDLKLYHETRDLIFVHAGLRPGIPLAEQTEDDLIWIRGPFLDDGSDHGKLVVHGHTPVETPEHWGNRVALDTGAGYGRPLTAAVFEGRNCFVLTENGRVPLEPRSVLR